MLASPVRALLLCLAGCLCLTLTLAACDPAVPTDEPAAEVDDAPLFAAVSVGQWRWVGPRGPNPMPGAPGDIGMRCRDGSATGFGFRRGVGADGQNLLLYLKGGGACFTSTNCMNSPASVSETQFFNDFANKPGDRSGSSGIFSPDNPDNPFLNWTVVFVPYCTGDFHSGDNPNGVVDGVAGTQQFVGYRNIERLLDVLVARGATSANTVMLAGTSAGGLGTIAPYGLIAERLAPAPVDLLDDSGPLPRADSVFTDSLEHFWRTLWNLETAIPDSCAACSQPNEDGLIVGMENLLPYYASTNPNSFFGLFSFTSDCAFRGIFCTNNPYCTASDSLCLTSPDRPKVDAQDFEDALFDLRFLYGTENDLHNVGTFYPQGYLHTAIQLDLLYDVEIGTTSLTDWIRMGLSGTATNVPATPYE